ncbi:MAG TPA: FkbM family methyltransferase [Nitrospiraceae bacterium]|nr:FkbM family methyltransferase [Nitrospiraceae bacterium]
MDAGPVLNLLRWYGLHSPIPRGKRLLPRIATAILGRLEGRILVSTVDGRLFWVDLDDVLYRDVYFMGFYERRVTNLASRLLRAGDVAFDVGANMGWYTTLFAKIVGAAGQVHSFEPSPAIFDRLQTNLVANGSPTWVLANQFALGPEETEAVIHTFAGLTHGHASLSELSRDDFSSTKCMVTTLDSYAQRHGVSKIDLIKCDVEGAELGVLEGSRNIVKEMPPPMWILEINDETSKAFGYTPADMLGVLSTFGYEFYAIRGKLVRVGVRSEYTHGDNVLAIVPAAHESRLKAAIS